MVRGPFLDVAWLGAVAAPAIVSLDLRAEPGEVIVVAGEVGVVGVVGGLLDRPDADSRREDRPGRRLGGRRRGLGRGRAAPLPELVADGARPENQAEPGEQRP